MPIIKKVIPILLLILFLTIPLVNAQFKDPYQSTADKIVSMLNYNWQYAFYSYNQSIYAGISSAQLQSSNLTFDPNNTNIGILSLAISSYDNLLSALDNANVKNASYYLGQIIMLGIQASNVFILKGFENKTTAQFYSTVIRVALTGNITVYKNYTVNGVIDAFQMIAKNDINAYMSMNITAIKNKSLTPKDFDITTKLLSNNISIIFALINQAINTHDINAFYNEIYYIGIILSIIAVFLAYINVKRFKKYIKPRQQLKK
jgi:hypothetical protein